MPNRLGWNLSSASTSATPRGSSPSSSWSAPQAEPSTYPPQRFKPRWFVDAYAAAAVWAAANPEQTAQILAGAAGLDPKVADEVVRERSNLDVDQVPGPTQLAVLEKIGPTFVELGDVPNQQQVDDALAAIVDDSFAKQADASRFRVTAEILATPQEARSGFAWKQSRRFRAVGGALIPVLVLAVWQWVSISGKVAVSVLPSPTMVWLAAVDLTERGLAGSGPSRRSHGFRC